MAVRSITVPVTIFTDDVEGCVYILLTDKDIEEQEDVNKKREIEADNLEGTKLKQDATRAKFIREQVKISRRLLDHQRTVRDLAMPHAQKLTYTLTKPLWRAYTEAEEGAKTLHEDGTVTTDRTALMLALMPGALSPGLSKDEIENLEPCVMAYLWEKLYNSLWPSAYRLGFSLPPAEIL